ncbi:thrombin-like enzyme acutobin [Bicyclus anynana]|uniref:Thrombin-like enzyme acutobin n=1 Tax=Bicyclus anynana TaxID=110368 RepID=A0A6J1N783_BICAN|nr:thrombin-like enzyme acutobin [Bicyclus anynana]
MSNVCCTEFQGWCRSFTKTEIFLCVLQAIFLTVFIVFLTFVILHLVVCSRSKLANDRREPSNITSAQSVTTYVTVPSEKNGQTQSFQTESTNHEAVNNSHINILPTLDKGVKCTWTPSYKTKALTHYYVNHTDIMMSTKPHVKEIHNKFMNSVSMDYKEEIELDFNKLLEVVSDGIEVNDSRKDLLLALVKIRPQRGVTFGCTLTIVNEFWTVTAASCIEAIEEVDSLDSFVMMQGFKDQDQKIHPVVDVLIHPQYQGINATFDLAVLKSETKLINNVTLAVTLPTFIDYFMISLGELLTILGYGRFRNIDKDTLARTVREVAVHSLPRAQCPRGAGAAPLCAGVLRARRSPCNYCSGTPLLRRRVLLGLMSDNQQCGLACEPALFVNVALAGDWLQSVISN